VIPNPKVVEVVEATFESKEGEAMMYQKFEPHFLA